MRLAAPPLVFLALLVGCGGDDGGSSAEGGEGRALFVERCGSCHTFRDAGTEGSRLDLDYDLRDVDAQRVLDSISDPPEGMPADLVTGEDAQAVADYVAGNRTPRE